MRSHFKNIKRIVVKVGTSSLSYPNGRLNFRRIEKLAYVLSVLRNKGVQIALVSSGAIGVGSGRLGLTKRPEELAKKQALAALGQAELIKIYQKLFEEYNQTVAQVLLTKDVITDCTKHQNAKNTLLKLFEMGIIPIINENDTISTFEIEFGDNDSLSADVATLVKAELLILMSDIDGLYTANPKTDRNATLIKTVRKVTPEIVKLASGKGTTFATGGMATKIKAADICLNSGISTIITNANDPSIIFKLIDGEEIGTLFTNIA